MAEKIKGKCKFCGEEYPFDSMGRHLGTCKVRQEQKRKEIGTKKAGYFDLAIYAEYHSSYWLFTEVKETATLKDLDQFLKDIWVECCDHLSWFTINDATFDNMPYADPLSIDPARSMYHSLKETLTKGLTFRYEYDAGSTTELVIKVADYKKRSAQRDNITLLSRNNPIEHMCDACGAKPAVYVNPLNLPRRENAFFCRDCIEEGAEFMLLPVCNSPRMGVCAYEGSECYPDQFVPDWTPDSSAKTAEEAT